MPFLIVGILAGMLWLLHQYSISKTNDKTEAAGYTFLHIIVILLVIFIPYGIVKAADAIDPSWFGIALIAAGLGYICYLSFRSEYLQNQRIESGEYHRISESIKKKLPTYEELLQIRADYFQKYDEYISDERAVKMWREQKFRELRNARIDEDHDIFGWRHKI